MAHPETDILQRSHRRNWVPLRTLVDLRWFAIAGQIVAILVALYGLRIDLAVGPISCLIGLSVIVNLVSTSITPRNYRLTEMQAALMIGFDIVQLGGLLVLSGGLTNPFAMLILAPVTVASTVLPLRSTAILGGIAIAVVTVLAFFDLPIVFATGDLLILPDLSIFGFWAALVIGLVFLTLYARQVTLETVRMSDALAATRMALAREQALTDLGGVVAAAAHELGTPLATIKLVSGELIDELAQSPDHLEDVKLIRAEADRCRDILRSMGRAGKEDLLVRQAPLEALVKEASEPHLHRGKTVEFQLDNSSAEDQPQPHVHRRSDVIHGLRNLIQNAVDFADTQVIIAISWQKDWMRIRIVDDGPGFPSSVLGRIGDPFVRRNRNNPDRSRRGYDGMGLGLFIAKTLLERSGAKLTFANGRTADSGAIVEVEWPRAAIEAPHEKDRGALGRNQVLDRS